MRKSPSIEDLEKLFPPAGSFANIEVDADDDFKTRAVFVAALSKLSTASQSVFAERRKSFLANGRPAEESAVMALGEAVVNEQMISIIEAAVDRARHEKLSPEGIRVSDDKCSW